MTGPPRGRLAWSGRAQVDRTLDGVDLVSFVGGEAPITIDEDLTQPVAQGDEFNDWPN